MKPIVLSLNRVMFLSSLMFLPQLFAPSQAQCVAADISIQAAVHGSRKPAQQTNDVSFSQQGACRGNLSINKSRQIQVGGTGPVVQQRQSHHHFQGDPSDPGPGGSVMFIPVGVDVDVYNAAEKLRSNRIER